MQRFSLASQILPLQSEDHFFMLQANGEINEHDEVSESLRNISQFIYSTSKLCKNVTSQGRFVVCCLETTIVIALGINTSNAELNPICHLLALLGAHHILQVSGVRIKRCLSNRRQYSEKKNSHTQLPEKNRRLLGPPARPLFTKHAETFTNPMYQLLKLYSS